MTAVAPDLRAVETVAPIDVEPVWTKPLTERQLGLYRFIVAHVHAHGFPPTWREILAHLGATSTNSARCHLDRLEKKGVILAERGRTRAIRIVPGLTVSARGVVGRVERIGQVSR